LWPHLPTVSLILHIFRDILCSKFSCTLIWPKVQLCSPYPGITRLNVQDPAPYHQPFMSVDRPIHCTHLLQKIRSRWSIRSKNRMPDRRRKKSPRERKRSPDLGNFKTEYKPIYWFCCRKVRYLKKAFKGLMSEAKKMRRRSKKKGGRGRKKRGGTLF
jgi:hypothetical protein